MNEIISTGKNDVSVYVGSTELGGVTEVKVIGNNTTEYLYEILSDKPWGVKRGKTEYRIILKQDGENELLSGSELSFVTDDKTIIFGSCEVKSRETRVEANGRITTVTELKSPAREIRRR